MLGNTVLRRTFGKAPRLVVGAITNSAPQHSPWFLSRSLAASAETRPKPSSDDMVKAAIHKMMEQKQHSIIAEEAATNITLNSSAEKALTKASLCLQVGK